jgi:flagellum-specific peptidoglycan hydrolase FlgJ
MYSQDVKNKTKWFIDKYGEGIALAIKGTGLYFPSVIAQQALESGWGTSDLTRLYNNWGGIKCAPHLEGAVGCIKMDTSEWTKSGKKYYTKQNFTRFVDAKSGMKAHLQVLMADRYANARNNAKSAKEQIKMIAAAGYTTGSPSEYLASMSGIIEAAQDYKGLGRIS